MFDRAALPMILALLVPAWISPTGSSALQGELDDRQTAEDTAVEFSRLEVTGRFDALYDLMHPDAQAVVPGEAVIGWYANEFAPLQPEVILVTGVSFVEWTWDATGATYPYTAEVSFVQPYADGSITQDVIRLVEDDAGAWRWFFGRDPAFVNEQVARYASQSHGDEGAFVAIVSVDDVSGVRLSGACYIINDASIEGCDENGDGQVDFAGVIPGTYTVTQTAAPTGYPRNADFEVTIASGQSTTITVPHESPEPDLPQTQSAPQPAAPSLLPGATSVAPDADQQCAAFAERWEQINGVPALTPEGITVYSGCWQDANGQWFLPSGPDDPRLPGGPILDANERQRTAVLRADVVADLNGLDSLLTPSGFRDDLYSMYSPTKRPVIGYLAPDYAGAPGVGILAAHYLEFFVPYVQGAMGSELRSYATWWGQRRIDAYPSPALGQFDALTQEFRRGELDPSGLDRAPWPWDLADPLTLDLYLQWALDTGRV